MSIRNNLSEYIKSIDTSDTLSQFMEKCNDNFSAIMKYGGGPNGERGDRGGQGAPTKPKVPIHVWIKGVDYVEENEIKEESYEIIDWNETDLMDSKYQDGHLIMLENGHVYTLEIDENFKLNPIFSFALQSFDPSIVIDGRTAYIHIAYAESPDGSGFEILTQPKVVESKSYMTLNSTSDLGDIINKPYLGICTTSYSQTPPESPSSYNWFRIQSSAYNVILSDPFMTIPAEDISENSNKIFSTYVYVYNNGIDICPMNGLHLPY